MRSLFRRVQGNSYLSGLIALAKYVEAFRISSAAAGLVEAASLQASSIRAKDVESEIVNACSSSARILTYEAGRKATPSPRAVSLASMLKLLTSKAIRRSTALA